MRPVLFQLPFSLPLFGAVEFPAYFTLLTIGFTLAAILTVRESRRLGQPPDLILDLNLWMVIWGLIGSRVLHLVADGHVHDYINLCVDSKKVPAIGALVTRCTSSAQCGYDFLCDAATLRCYPPKDCFAALKLWRGGFAYYGGFIFAVGFAVWFVRRHQLGWWRTADLASPGIALGLVLGRLGCFFNGCCYGKTTASSWGVVFPRGSIAWQAQLDAGRIGETSAALPVHATQLYESFACFLIFLILYYFVRPRRRAFGEVFAWLLILYAVARSICELYRDDDRGVFLGVISTSQIISLPLFVGGIALLIYLRKQKARGRTAS